ncbi:MAG: hypothetical protein V1896_02720 [Candidatus Zambryskibacteria bacterium]
MRKFFGKKIIIAVILVGLVGIIGWQNGWFKSPILNSSDSAVSDFSSSFYLNYSKDFQVRNEDVGDDIKKYIFENGELKQGFEITIIPFDESGPLTAERIKQDLPDLAMNNVKDFFISTDIKGISFDSTDENIGDTHEVWFSAKGELYQFRTYKEFGAEMEDVIKTFTFKL